MNVTANTMRHVHFMAAKRWTLLPQNEVRGPVVVVQGGGGSGCSFMAYGNCYEPWSDKIKLRCNWLRIGWWVGRVSGGGLSWTLLAEGAWRDCLSSTAAAVTWTVVRGARRGKRHKTNEWNEATLTTNSHSNNNKGWGRGSRRDITIGIGGSGAVSCGQWTRAAGSVSVQLQFGRQATVFVFCCFYCFIFVFSPATLLISSVWGLRLNKNAVAAARCRGRRGVDWSSGWACRLPLSLWSLSWKIKSNYGQTQKASNIWLIASQTRLVARWWATCHRLRQEESSLARLSVICIARNKLVYFACQVR